MSEKEHRAHQREAPEPEEGAREVPKFVFVYILILIAWGVGYYAWQIGKPMQGGDSRTATAQQAVSSESGSAVVDGAVVYNTHCIACHQGAGRGIPGAFPPLAGSEWVLAEPAITVSIVQDGLKGPIVVAGGTYNGVMPYFHGKLSSTEIAAVLTYIRSEWGNDATTVNPFMVDEHITRFGEREPWTADELIKAFGKP